MKYIIASALIFILFLSEGSANQCQQDEFRNTHICIISGGAADTTTSLNLGHARSLALKNARILAYEKMAERLEGIILAANSDLKNELLHKGTINTIVKASLKNVVIQKENVSFLSDGSPWAEVTLSAPIKKSFAEEVKVLEYTNAVNTQGQQDDITYIIDLRSYNYKRSHFFKISDESRTVFKFNSFLGNKATFIQDITEAGDIKYKLIIPTKISQSNIEVSSTDSETLALAEYRHQIVKRNKVFFLYN